MNRLPTEKEARQWLDDAETQYENCTGKWHDIFIKIGKERGFIALDPVTEALKNLASCRAKYQDLSLLNNTDIAIERKVVDVLVSVLLSALEAERGKE